MMFFCSSWQSGISGRVDCYCFTVASHVWLALASSLVLDDQSQRDQQLAVATDEPRRSVARAGDLARDGTLDVASAAATRAFATMMRFEPTSAKAPG